MAMPYPTNASLPEAVREALPGAAQTVWRTIFNAAFAEYDDESKAFATAWAGLRRAGWRPGAEGERWHKMAQAQIVKMDEAEHLVFGWASVAIRKDGEQIEDYQGDMLDADDLEAAAYAFNLDFREANAEHTGPVVGYLVESLVVTKAKLAALGLAEDALPQGWWVGFHVPDEAAWARVAKGDYAMFSIEGTAEREEVV